MGVFDSCGTYIYSQVLGGSRKWLACEACRHPLGTVLHMSLMHFLILLAEVVKVDEIEIPFVLLGTRRDRRLPRRSRTLFATEALASMGVASPKYSGGRNDEEIYGQIAAERRERPGIWGTRKFERRSISLMITHLLGA